MMIRESALRDGGNASFLQIIKKALWSSDAAEDNWALRHSRYVQFSPRAQNVLSVNWKAVRGGVVDKHDGMSTAERREWFTQSPGRKKRISRVGRAEQEDVEIAMELAVLEAV